VWGSNAKGQLGLDNVDTNIDAPRMVPDKINGVLSRPPATMVACGENFTALLTNDGCPWTSGHGEVGELGHGLGVVQTSVFTMIQSKLFEDKLISMIAIGPTHCIVLDIGKIHLLNSNL